MCMLIIILLSAAVIYLAAKMAILKKQMRSVLRQLEINHSKMVHIEFADADLELLTAKVNDMIDRIWQIQIEGSKKAKVLKQNIADISHDMRTPLTSVIGYLQFALKECTDNKVRSNILTALERAQYCSSLIEDFFEISVMDTDEIRPVLEKLDISGIICEEILANVHIFEKKAFLLNLLIPVYLSGLLRTEICFQE